MEKSSTLSRAANLEEIRDQFEPWRRTRKNRRDPIPPQLWKAAVKLAGSYSIHSISKALRLNYSDLKDRVHDPFTADTVKTLPAAGFIDLGCRQRLFESECIIEVQKACGLKMKISVRGKTAIKILVYDGQGFWLCQKRLSKGRFCWWPDKRQSPLMRVWVHELQLVIWNNNPKSARAAPVWKKIAS